MKKTKDLIINIKEEYGNSCLDDSITKTDKEISLRKPQGYVEIYEIGKDGEKQLVGKNNLVLYNARELIAIKLMNENHASITPDKDEFISWLGLGSGGVSVGDPFTPLPPESGNNALAEEIPINATDSTCGDFHDGAYYKHPLDSLVLERDDNNAARWLILKITTTIGAEDANGFQISEAGLFSSLSSVPGYNGPFSLLARVTFTSIVKDISRRLIMIWHIYV